MAERVRPTLIVFAKAPVPGQVKRRLASCLGDVAATALYRRMTALLLRRLGSDPRWRAVLAVTPPAARAARFAAWGTAIARFAQGDGNIGRRMAAAFRAVPRGPVVLVGSDIPDMRASDIAAAFRALRRADAVFGPAEDGGYWLVGFARASTARALLAPVRWSTKHALADTLKALGPSRRIRYVRRLRDLDTAADYAHHRARLSGGAPQDAE